jgi:hypothetical protein
VFLEHVRHVAEARNLLDSGDRFKLIALDPATEYALEKNGLEFAIPDQYYTEEEINELGIGNFALVESFCDYVDRWLSQRSDLLAEHGVRPAWYNYFALKVLFDAITLRLFILTRVLTSERPAEVWYFPPKITSHINPFLLFEESIYSYLIPLSCSHQNIPAQVLEEGSHSVVRYSEASTPSRRSHLRALLRRLSPLRTAIGGPGGYLRAWGNRLRNGSKTTILVAGLAEEDVQLVTRELLKQSTHRLLYWRPGSSSMVGLCPWSIVRLDGKAERAAQLEQLAAKTRELWPRLFQDGGFREYLVARGIDYSSVVESRLQFMLTDLLTASVRTYLQGRELIARCQPRMVLLSQVANPWQHAISAAAKSTGVPVVSYQHGDFGTRLAPIGYYTECAEPDFMLVYGQGVEEFCRRHYPEGAMPIAVGSLELDQLARSDGRAKRHGIFQKLGLDPTKKTIVYCPTNVYGNMFYISYSYPKSDSRYFYIQRRIVETFKDFPSVQLVVKQHPSTSPHFPIKDSVSDQGISNCTLVRDEVSFADLLPLADLFILDSPTMTFLEILTTGKPVLIFNDWFQWEKGTLELVKQSAVFTDDLEEFIKILRGYLSHRHFEEAARDGGEYLKHYGTYLGDGRSAGRAVDAIDAIIQGHITKADNRAATLEG